MAAQMRSTISGEYLARSGRTASGVEVGVTVTAVLAGAPGCEMIESMMGPRVSGVEHFPNLD